MRVRIAAAAGIVVLVCAACGAESESGSEVARPKADAAPIESLPAIETDEPCPDSNPSTGGVDAVMAESARLEPMLGQVLAYGGQHPEEFGTYGLVWQGVDASVFISFTSNLDAHRVVLGGIVDHPDELIVCHVAMSGDAGEALQATLIDELEGRFLSIGRGMGAVEVDLAPDEEALAAELLARYGDAIELTVGALAYPIDIATSVCPAPPDTNELRGLEIAIVAPLEPLTAAGVQPLQLTVTLTNVGDSQIRFTSGMATGTILDTGGNVVSSSQTVEILDFPISVDLAPGASTELPLVASNASCDPRLGYTIPPGDYQIIAEVQHSDGTNSTLRSAPLPIVIAG